MSKVYKLVHTSKRKKKVYTVQRRNKKKVVKDTTPNEGIWHRLPFAKPIRKFKINWISNLPHQLVENIPNPTAFRILIKWETA